MLLLFVYAKPWSVTKVYPVRQLACFSGMQSRDGKSYLGSVLIFLACKLLHMLHEYCKHAANGEFGGPLMPKVEWEL